MAKKLESSETIIDQFLRQRVQSGKLAQADLDKLTAKKSKKDSTLTGKKVADLTSADQLKLLAIIAIRLGLADENGKIL
jgi:hypothetical protein